MKPGDCYHEAQRRRTVVQTYEQWCESREAMRRFDAGDPDDDTPPTEDNDDQDLEPIDDIFAPPVPADWYPS